MLRSASSPPKQDWDSGLDPGCVDSVLGPTVYLQVSICKMGMIRENDMRYAFQSVLALRLSNFFEGTIDEIK